MNTHPSRFTCVPCDIVKSRVKRPSWSIHCAIAAFLPDGTICLGHTTSVQPCSTTAQCWMACKRHLATRRKNTQGVICAGLLWWQQKGCFSQVSPGSKGLHLGVSHTGSINDNSQPVTFGRRCREHITLDKTPRRQRQSGRSHRSRRSRNNPLGSWLDIADGSLPRNKTSGRR